MTRNYGDFSQEFKDELCQEDDLDPETDPGSR